MTDALYLKPSVSTSSGTVHRALRPLTTHPRSGNAEVSTLRSCICVREIEKKRAQGRESSEGEGEGEMGGERWGKRKERTRESARGCTDASYCSMLSPGHNRPAIAASHCHIYRHKPADLLHFLLLFFTLCLLIHSIQGRDDWNVFDLGEAAARLGMGNTEENRAHNAVKIASIYIISP